MASNSDDGNPHGSNPESTDGDGSADGGCAGGSNRDRRRIFGLETEYLVLYQPEDPNDKRRPPFSVIENLLFKAILQGRKAVCSAGLKGGYFLENGGMVHLEFFMQEQADTPILEAATPECSSPRDLLTYQRAFDRILSSASGEMWKALRNAGYRGRITFGKNNLDSRGVGYGCHENYLVRFQTKLAHKLLVFCTAPFLLVLSLPLILLILALFLILASIALVYFAALITLVFLSAFCDLEDWIRDLGGRIRRALPRSLFDFLSVFLFYMVYVALFPLIAGYTLLLRAVAYPPFLDNLTPFVVSRQILTGAGRLDPETGLFEMSQRPHRTTSVSKIFMFGQNKTMYDLKGFLYDPLAVFRNSRKLTLFLGDSNLSDCANLLKFGATGLVLEMIEAGIDFSDLRLRHPVRAFRDVSAGGPWKEIDLHNRRRGSRLTAIELQREYLARAKAYVDRERPSNDAYREILALWEETLEEFEDQPGALSRKLDWSAKKALLDQAILPVTNWKEFGAWLRAIHRIPVEKLAAGSSLDEILASCRARVRSAVYREIRRRDLDEADFAPMLDLYFQCRKIDLRYHEIGCLSGYQRQLESEGVIDRWTEPEEVQAATREPPLGTRARVRSYYIKLSPSPWSSKASWNEVYVPGTNTVVSLADPFESSIPTD